ncbi:FAD binding domain-containing protein [Amycolatopsis anabasis]|uniref:FAD binding domain-containing protein n=1 Tax=Amycolatopsis anabasis TaxID=1840409 RepID=UPI00131E33CA|nr:FAD binding domain-containing protein [Amycolatopsis anabasis]
MDWVTIRRTPAALAAASELLSEYAGEAAVLGGGTVLLPMMHRAEITARHVVDLRGLGLDTVTEHAGHVEIGAMATYRDLLASPVLARRAPLLPRMAAGVTGGDQVRNLGTIGGSACFANPSSDVPAVLVALGVTLRVHGTSGYRDVAAADFFRGAFTTDLADGEFLASLLVPHRPGRNGYHKLKLCEGSWPIVTAVATIHPPGATSSPTRRTAARWPEWSPAVPSPT